ncbi:MAG: hypothetical protein ACP6IP_06490 [Candidatus Njordarchaeia archaeon]
MRKGAYSLKPVFIADHEKHYHILKDDDIIGDLYIHPRFKDARVELFYEEILITENNCDEALNKIKEEEVRELISDVLKKFDIC